MNRTVAGPGSMMTQFLPYKLQPALDSGQTVTVDVEDLRAATRLLQTLIAASHPPIGRSTGGQLLVENENQKRDRLRRRARQIFDHRRLRSHVFSKAMFGEPAWDVLIALYMTDQVGPRLTINRLSELSASPMTTALRWIDYLEKQALVRRESHPTDRRAVFIELTDKGRSSLDEYLSGIPSLG